jgi:hypothetical protein
MEAGTDSHSFISNENARNRVAFELKGTLAKSTQEATLFALYLAMHSELEPHTVSIENLDSCQSEGKVKEPCFYRRAALSLSKEAEWSCDVQSQLRHKKEYQSAWLQECLHPSPIHYRNNKNYIDDAVIQNMSLAGQWRMRQSSEKQASQRYELATDATLLADIVGPAQSML